MPTAHLRRVQRRRELPTRVTQRLQLLVQERVIHPGGPAARVPASIPAPFRLLGRAVQPVVQRVAARLVGQGFRPERVHTDA